MLLIGLLVVAALTGCAETVDSPQTPAFAIEKHYKKGSAEVILRIGKTEITTAEKTALTIESLTQSGYTAIFPDIEMPPDSLQVADAASPPPLLEESGRVRHIKTFTLKPFLPGTFTVPSLKINVTRSGDSKAEPVVIETEPVDIRVKSLLPESGDANIREILPPEALPRNYILPAAAGIAAVALLAGLFFGFRKFNRRNNSATTIRRRPAHDIALESLEALLSEYLAEKGEYKAFYLRLSAILRHYIEDRFGLRAPEQTTEEFLAAVKSSGDLAIDHKQLLRKFLEHCDLVKFAELRPTDAEVSETLTIFKRFVAETRPPIENGLPPSMQSEDRRHAV